MGEYDSRVDSQSEESEREEERKKRKNIKPSELVSELDKYIVGQKEAKKAVAVALRNRWRRHCLDKNIREEVMPKNILMIGSTGKEERVLYI